MKHTTENQTGGTPYKPMSQPQRAGARAGAGHSKAPAQSKGAANESCSDVVTQTSDRATKANPNGPEQHGLVHIELAIPAAERVCIAGSFNEWEPDGAELRRSDGDKWTKDLALAPGVYEYRFVVDGKWMPDPNAARSVPNPFGEPNSLLIVPAPSEG
jgi:Glycogen recognition site of AMP-activated protein kinase